jgi:dihydroorotate dehydrogenase
MGIYKSILRPILFKVDAEKAHHFSVRSAQLLMKLPGLRSLAKSYFRVDHPSLEREVFGLKFKNPIGLAAGFDKNAEYTDEMEAFGFGFVEIGTLTPKGQPGNPKKRIFRLSKDQALINRLGFNNRGVDDALPRLARKRNIIVGGNIGKNKSTENENAKADYQYSFEQLYPYVDYFVVNVSSPNTPNLRDLQEAEPLKELLSLLIDLRNEKSERKPILLKIAPDLSQDQLDQVIDIAGKVKLDGLIATNTTLSREALKSVDRKEKGGLSGRPLSKKSTDIIRYISKKTNAQLPIIGVGGVFTAQDALEKLEAGASLVQIYTGFAYEGPNMVKRINQGLIAQSQK